jgi:hypothetical protein
MQTDTSLVESSLGESCLIECSRVPPSLVECSLVESVRLASLGWSDAVRALRRARCDLFSLRRLRRLGQVVDQASIDKAVQQRHAAHLVVRQALANLDENVRLAREAKCNSQAFAHALMCPRDVQPTRFVCQHDFFVNTACQHDLSNFTNLTN